MLLRIAIVLLCFGASSSSAEDSVPDPSVETGRALAESLCSQCHAIGGSGRSPHVDAPPFHELSRRLDLDALSDRLREALTVDHPDMPAFRFTRPDARAFLLYLRSIQRP
jgi:mono/diheme cytochrome c family protein